MMPATLPSLTKLAAMSNLSGFPITQRWPAQQPDRIQLFSLSPNAKIPAIIDPQDPGGKPLAVFEDARLNGRE